MIAVSPQLGELLTKAAPTPDFETALRKVLSEYIELKIESLEAQIAHFEQKWGMSFEEFARRSQEGTLGEDPYSWDVEQDFWTWEKAITLFEHYTDLRF